MKKTMTWAAMAATIMMVAGCAASKPVEEVPEWYLNKPSDPNMIFGVGSGQSSRMQIARDKAAQSARNDLAQTIEVKFDGLTKQFTEETGSGEDAQLLEYFVQATKSVVSTVLNGASVDKTKVQQKSGTYTAYVLMSMDVAASNQALLDKLKQQDNMYTKFRASETFKELDKETAKME